MEQGIFLTIHDLLRLTGGNNIKSAQRTHKAIRDAYSKTKRKLTIKEYCEHEDLNYTEIYNFLRGSKK